MDIHNLDFAPIVLFTYNRMLHTQETLNYLSRNQFAKKSELFIYSDGPKGDSDTEKVGELRRYFRTLTGFKSIHIIEREKNLGLAANIIDGVSDIVNQYGKIIVLEDDIITSKYFLRYMNAALRIYENEPGVMQISGFSYPVKKQGLPETAFLRFADCWGWGTWKDRWALFEKNPRNLIKSFTRTDIYHFNLENGYDYWNQVIRNYRKEIDTWAVFWYASIFCRHGYMLYPRESLTQNIGFDDSGTNCSASNDFKAELADTHVKRFPSKVSENKLVRRRISAYFKGLKPGRIQRIFYRIKRIIRRMRSAIGRFI